MANMTTLAVSDDEYRDIIRTLERGYTSELKDRKGKTYYICHRPNKRVAFALRLEYATGLRISDIVKLRQKDIVKDGDRYRLDVIEQKTKKKRTFRISQNIYDCIDSYCAENKIPSDQPIIGTTTYAIQKQLKFVSDYLGLERVSTHSLRKSASIAIYRKTGNDIVAVQDFLQHSSPMTSARYINVRNPALDNAIDSLSM